MIWGGGGLRSFLLSLDLAVTVAPSPDPSLSPGTGLRPGAGNAKKIWGGGGLRSFLLFLALALAPALRV